VGLWAGFGCCSWSPDGHGICHLTARRSFGCGVSASAVEASEAAQRRQELELGRTRLGAIQDAIVERPNYQYWLNHIAASAPDTVYFDRLNFDGSQLSSAVIPITRPFTLRMLTEEPGYTDVAALSAFARDRNNGLERFSIQWRVTEPPPVAESADSEPLAGDSTVRQRWRHELQNSVRRCFMTRGADTSGASSVACRRDRC